MLSVKTRGTVPVSRIATAEEVRIRRFTALPCLRAEFRIDVVPRTAGMIRSEYISFSKFLKKGEHFQEKKDHTVGIGSLEVERRGGVGDDVDSLDCLVKGSILGDILDDDELKSITITGKFIHKECALDQ